MKKNQIRLPWKQTVALVLFFATSLGVAGYSLGYFALPGGKPMAEVTTNTPILPSRPSVGQTTVGDAADTTSPVTETPPSGTLPDGVTYVTNLSSAFNPQVIEGYIDERATVSLAQRMAVYNKLAGIIETRSDATPVSYESYTSDTHTLVRGVRLAGDFTDGKEVIVRYSKVYSSEDGSYQTMATEYTVERKKVQPYMGYLILSHVEQREVAVETASQASSADAASPETDQSAAPSQTILRDVTVLTLCDRSGSVLIEYLGGKTPYYARDNKNRPVFSDESGQLYAFDGEKMNEISEGALRIWLRYDYPAYPLGVYRDYEAVYDPTTGKYFYRNRKTGDTAITTDYFKAFNFSENGFAVVVNAKDNVLQVVNRSKRVQFNAGGRYKFPTGVTGHSLSAKNTFRLPDTLGIESIGSIGYDHGWLRIRVQALSQMSNSFGTVISDWEALVDEEGNFFDIPEGYSLEGYSDGVLLLSKDGLYGYYSIDGKWITQPIFTYARPFIQGLAVVGSANGTVGMIDTSGNIVLPFVFTSLSDVSSGVVTAYCEGIGWETYYMVEK